MLHGERKLRSRQIGKKTTEKERNATRRRRGRKRGKYPHGSAERGLDRGEMSASISAFGILEIFI